MSVRMGSGPPSASVMIVGEVWGESEERSGIPFSGSSGQELNKMLHEAGIMRADCYVTNVVNARPPRGDVKAWIPEEKKFVTPDMVLAQGRHVKPIVAEGLAMLRKEIELVNPRIIIALGGTALWALTGNTSITKWRGSLLETAGPDGRLVRVIPTYHPAAIMRVWEWRAIAVGDLRRAAKELAAPVQKPEWNFIVRPGFETVFNTLSMLREMVEKGPTWIDLDLETKYGHIACCGLSWSKTDAICIPFIEETDRDGYWMEKEEAIIVHQLWKLLTHPNCWVRGQNLLYDCQYIYRRWHFIPNVKQDTMISHHVLWAGLPKNLAFQASMYCEYYVNWKPDKETWKEGG